MKVCRSSLGRLGLDHADVRFAGGVLRRLRHQAHVDVHLPQPQDELALRGDAHRLHIAHAVLELTQIPPARPGASSPARRSVA
jgi:hypothetical protein